MNYDALDHPIWNALSTGQRDMALRKGDAAMFAAEVSPLAAVREPTTQAFRDLRELADGRTIGLVMAAPYAIPDGWTTLVKREIDQMVWAGGEAPSQGPPLLRLTEADVPEMMALAKATEPGPFAPETITMGPFYFGIRVGGRLAAMAGQRMNLDRFREVSAVCTYPEFRGRGYAGVLMNAVMREILAEGKTPFLHVKTENAAKTLYEKLGFRVRTAVHFAVIKPA